MRLLVALFVSMTMIGTAAAVTLPLPRPDRDAAVPEVTAIEPAGPAVSAPVDDQVPVPRPRPAHFDDAPPAAPAVPDQPAIAPAETPAEPDIAVEPAPQAEPARIYQTACPALTLGLVQGEMLPPIAEGQCVAQSPLSITGVMVNGRLVPISGPVTTDCAMASMLPRWMDAVDGYVWARDNTRLAGISIGTGYMCRNRVGGTADALSEHGFADALDVSGFTLEDGRSINVEAGWPGSEEQGSRIVRYAHDAACSIFMTTLGPEANAEHHDHIHVDMGCHGKTCTARLCE